jgi:hypothetical protein
MSGWAVLSGRKPARSRSGHAGFSGLTIIIVILVLGVIGFIGWQIFQSQYGSGLILKGTGGLVPVPVPKTTVNSGDNNNASPDGVPDGYSAYSNTNLGFSFVYPDAWGALQPSSDATTVLSLATPKIQKYSLAEALQVQVIKKDTFRIPINDNGAIVAPIPSGLGSGYDWNVTNKGKDAAATVGRLYPQQPSVAYQSGKASVYSFLNSSGSCTYTTWVLAVQDNFVKLRLPSFCISSKPGDTDVQAGQKAAFDNIEDTILHSITVL